MNIRKICTALLALGMSNVVQAEHVGTEGAHGNAKSAAALSVPTSVATEHEELHRRLNELTTAGGKTGSAARDVEKLLAPHFVKEEKYALPPLSLLPELAAGREIRDHAAVLRMTDQLAREMPQMLAEHKQVVAALKRLRDAAEADGKQEGVRFAEALQAHALTEEQILYPAALLVGRYLGKKAR